MEFIKKKKKKNPSKSDEKYTLHIQITETSIFAPYDLLLRITIPQININLHSVSKIVVSKVRIAHQLQM